MKKTLPEEGQDWAIHYAYFARNGFTEAAQAEARNQQATLVDLKQMDEGLSDT